LGAFRFATTVLREPMLQGGAKECMTRGPLVRL
jgi:hypothetical protein